MNDKSPSGPAASLNSPRFSRAVSSPLRSPCGYIHGRAGDRAARTTRNVFPCASPRRSHGAQHRRHDKYTRALRCTLLGAVAGKRRRGARRPTPSPSAGIRRRRAKPRSSAATRCLAPVHTSGGREETRFTAPTPSRRGVWCANPVVGSIIPVSGEGACKGPGKVYERSRRR